MAYRLPTTYKVGLRTYIVLFLRETKTMLGEVTAAVFLQLRNPARQKYQLRERTIRSQSVLRERTLPTFASSTQVELQILSKV